MKSLLFTFCLLVSCSSVPGPCSIREKQVLHLNLSAEPPTLDSRLATDQTSATVLRHLYEGLMRSGPNGVEFGIAERYEVMNGGLSYRFFLRSARWSDGELVIAQDFVKTWQDILDPKFPADYAYHLYILKNAEKIKEGSLPKDALGAKAISDGILELHLSHPAPYFLELLAHTVFYPVKDEEKSISNGPFALEAWSANNEIRIVRNPTYWDAKSVKLHGIHFSIVSDASTELHLFDSGALDWVGAPLSTGLPRDVLPALKTNKQLHKVDVAASYFYIFNTKKEPFNNAKMRRAFALAVQRQAIIDNILQSGQRPATSFVPPMIKKLEKEFFADGDTAQALQLFEEGLKEEGWTRESLPPIVLEFNTAEQHLKIAEAIQDQWRRALSVDVELRHYEWKVYLDQLRQKEFSIARLGWAADFSDPMNFLELFQEADGGNNHSGWSPLRYQEILAASDRELDPVKRSKSLFEAEELLMESMPVLPLHFMTNAYLQKACLHGVRITSLGDVDFSRAWIESENLP